MTITRHQTTRHTCPSWCERAHADGDLAPEAHRGLQWSPVVADDGYWVDIPRVQNKDGDVVVRVTASGRGAGLQTGSSAPANHR